VITGLLQIKPRSFLPIALFSAITWSAICVLTGRILGNYWNYAGNKTGNVIVSAAIIVSLIILLIVFMQKFITHKNYQKRNENKSLF
jgi:membrane protein DedA with SNARE-associated domain